MCLNLVKKMRNIGKFRTFADFQKKQKKPETRKNYQK